MGPATGFQKQKKRYLSLAATVLHAVALSEEGAGLLRVLRRRRGLRHGGRGGAGGRRHFTLRQRAPPPFALSDVLRGDKMRDLTDERYISLV